MTKPQTHVSFELSQVLYFVAVQSYILSIWCAIHNHYLVYELTASELNISRGSFRGFIICFVLEKRHANFLSNKETLKKGTHANNQDVHQTVDTGPLERTLAAVLHQLCVLTCAKAAPR